MGGLFAQSKAGFGSGRVTCGGVEMWCGFLDVVVEGGVVTVLVMLV